MQLGHRCESLVTSSITIFDPSIFRGVESFYYVSSSREAFRFRVVKGATRSTKEPCQKWLEEGLKPVTFKTVEGKGEFLWEKVSFKFSWWKKKLWSGTASWIFQWMIKRREFLWWKIWRISSLSFVLLFSRRNFELIFRFMSSQLRKFERRFFFIMNTRNRSFVSGIKYMCLYVRA